MEQLYFEDDSPVIFYKLVAEFFCFQCKFKENSHRCNFECICNKKKIDTNGYNKKKNQKCI